MSPLAKQSGLGAGFNSMRVYDGIAYLAGYNTPATLFGTLSADVHDPTVMEPLSFVPCNPGTRCPYARVNQRRKILVGTQDTSSSNPHEVAAGVPAPAGVSLVDVSDLGNPQLLGFFETRPNGATHGFDIDDRYVYTCANRPESKPGGGGNQERSKFATRRGTASSAQFESRRVGGLCMVGGRHLRECVLKHCSVITSWHYCITMQN